MIRTKYLLVAALAALLLSAGCYKGTHPPRVNSPAPDFTLTDNGKTVALHEMRDKVVVLNFWATWCPPCIEELPSLMQMQQRLKDRGVQVLAISLDVDEKGYQKFMQDNRIDLLSLRDPDQKTNTVYGTFKFPETYVIDRAGVVRRKFIGPVDWNQAEIDNYLTSL